jgi:acyl-CoA synthetase (AMP-forming)/AMP-acid ligase II
MLHAWGMTEMSPLGTVCRPRSYTDGLPDDERYAIRAKQGSVVAGVDMRIVDDAGQIQPWDGKAVGEIQVRGPWVTSGYYNNPAGAASSPTTAGSGPATWRRSIPTATCRSPTGRRTSSSPAASGSRAWTWRAPSWAIPRCSRPR